MSCQACGADRWELERRLGEVADREAAVDAEVARRVAHLADREAAVARMEANLEAELAVRVSRIAQEALSALSAAKYAREWYEGQRGAGALASRAAERMAVAERWGETVETIEVYAAESAEPVAVHVVPELTADDDDERLEGNPLAW